VFSVASLILLAGCDNRGRPAPPASTKDPARRSVQPAGYGDANRISLPQADQRLCTAVAILVDTSGSMKEAVADRQGAQKAKHAIARQALERIIAYTGQWQEKHPDRNIQLSVLNFSSSARTVLPMAEFDQQKAQTAVSKIPHPGGGTAVGDALAKGFQALYQSGCVRKYLVCITDGQNTVGPRPDRVARQLYGQTGGEVEIHFVAFDTSAGNFRFLDEVNGYTVEAADGGQLDSRLSEIYEKRILAEAMPAERQD